MKKLMQRPAREEARQRDIMLVPDYTKRDNAYSYFKTISKVP